MPDYSSKYSDRGFWSKVKRTAAAAGKKVLTAALKLYYVAQDADTPGWAKAQAYAALGYFIFPVDAIPDVTPAIGYSDDLGVLFATVAALAAHVKPEHTKKANATVDEWLD